VTYLLIDQKPDHVNIATGLSLFQVRTAPDSTAVSTNYAAARGAVTYTHRFSERAVFGQVVEVLPALNNNSDVRINAETSLSAPLSRRIGIKLAYVIHYDNRPPDARTTTDRRSTSGLQFSW
jgi:putative salt-induced outer membrane protein YdiY